MPQILPPAEYRLTQHVRFEMERRGISEAEVVTAYRTSKIDKYWKGES